jgi:hypothetical protein
MLAMNFHWHLIRFIPCQIWVCLKSNLALLVGTVLEKMLSADLFGEWPTVVRVLSSPWKHYDPDPMAKHFLLG